MQTKVNNNHLLNMTVALQYLLTVIEQLPLKQAPNSVVYCLTTLVTLSRLEPGVFTGNLDLDRYVQLLPFER